MKDPQPFICCQFMTSAAKLGEMRDQFCSDPGKVCFGIIIGFLIRRDRNVFFLNHGVDTVGFFLKNPVVFLPEFIQSVALFLDKD